MCRVIREGGDKVVLINALENIRGRADDVTSRDLVWHTSTYFWDTSWQATSPAVDTEPDLLARSSLEVGSVEVVDEGGDRSLCPGPNVPAAPKRLLANT